MCIRDREYTRLKEVIAKGAERNQLAKNQQELNIVRSALLNSGLPQMEQTVRALDNMGAADVQKFIDVANKAAKDAYAPEVQRRAAAVKPEEKAKTKLNVFCKRLRVLV